MSVVRSRLVQPSPAAVFVAATAAAAVLAVWTPSDDPARTLCMWRRTTGVPCPGCGMTRAASHLLQGDLGAALAYHPLVLVVAVQAVVAWGWWSLASRGRLRPLRGSTVTVVLLSNLALLVAVWVVRAVSGTLPP